MAAAIHHAAGEVSRQCDVRESVVCVRECESLWCVYVCVHVGECVCAYVLGGGEGWCTSRSSGGIVLAQGTPPARSSGAGGSKDCTGFRAGTSARPQSL